MGSRIEEFQDENEKDSEILVTIDGPSGAGKGTLAELIADELDVKSFSAGDFFRDIAEEKGLTVEELSEKADKKTDIKVDRRTLEKGLSENCVIESRIASWVLGDYSDLSIYVTADLEERARRVLSDLQESSRIAEEHVDTLEEACKKISKRDQDNKERYKDYYGIDVEDIQMYDLVLDNTELSIDRQAQLVRNAIKRQFPERFEE